MLFNSLTFLVFFSLVYISYWVAPTAAGKKYVLLIASYCFYAAWSPPYIFLLFVSTAMDWWLARLIGGAESKSTSRLLLLISIACNIALLGYFKYGAFLQDNFSLLLAGFGVKYQPLKSNIILPIGISFYTFASLSYTIDVYRRHIKSEWRFTDYALFVSFFPHLVAGPIVRAGCLLPQIVAPRQPTYNQIGWGISLIVMGLFSKAVMADVLFAPIVDHFYTAPWSLAAIDAWPAILSFSGQIYYDFCGYTLCAIGLAMMFGISFPDNFQYPYAARTFSDFWRRWHISLSSWLRDYVYVSLGGNRRGKLLTFLCLLLTMLIGGLWHGPSWMFILWGALHGTYLVFERIYRNFRATNVAPKKNKYRPAEFLIFVIVTLTWIPFRAANASQAGAVITSLFRAPTFASHFGWKEFLAIVAMLATLIWHVKLRDQSLEQIIERCGAIWLSVTLSLCLISLFLFSGGDEHAFIYFQF